MRFWHWFNGSNDLIKTINLTKHQNGKLSKKNVRRKTTKNKTKKTKKKTNSMYFLKETKQKKANTLLFDLETNDKNC